MDENKAAATNEEAVHIDWTGFAVGLLVGAGLFYVTIQLISTFMFSRTAA